MFTTEAWVLYAGSPHNGEPKGLRKENFSFPALGDEEVLAEPIYGCWEANMEHAIARSPVDICCQRGEQKIVIGNAGVVRVLKSGSAVTGLKEGDCCLVFSSKELDEFGFQSRTYAYDAPGTVGLLAKQTKLHKKQLIPIPPSSKYSLEQWAGFAVRYITAWANWKLAFGCWRLHELEEYHQVPFVWGWGGGVAFAELQLAQLEGMGTALISSSRKRLKMISQAGMTPIDRCRFANLYFDEFKYHADPEYKREYVASEQVFLEMVKEATEGRGVSIFIDLIGPPVYRATSKAVRRPGIITSAGWKEGVNISMVRAIECMKWHILVHTHYARYRDGVQAVQFAEEHGWVPPVDDHHYGWDEIPQLAADYQAGRIDSYFPIYSVNPL